MPSNLPEPVGEQKNVVYLRDSGHVVVLGTAGSGKTTMAVTRAIWLADHAPEIAGPTLLVTFNKALVTYLRKTVQARSPNLVVENYHSFAKGYLAYRNLMGRRDIVDSERPAMMERAIAEVQRRYPGVGVLRRPLRFFEDEFLWLAGHGVTDEQTYIKADRIGRGRALGPADRPYVYAVREEYRRLRREAGKRYDWDDLALAARKAFEVDNTPRRYRHVVVDEGQDFTPEMIRSLAAAVGPTGTLTFFGDYAQQVYGRRLSWKSLGLNVRGGGAVHFEQNYRNTPQIARLAVALSNMPFFRDEVDLVEPRIVKADGPLPVLLEYPDRQTQFREAVELARRLGRSMTVAVLFRKRKHDAEVSAQLPLATRLHRQLSTWPLGPNVFYGTYHAAKGLEFDAVIIPFCDHDLLPDPVEVAAHGPDEAMSREARMLYVAVTRAKVRLHIMYSGKLTPLLPSDPALFQRTAPR
ncbi:3'-5' exonuclease [Micromonospora sp. NPDC048842]|uniref:3'-5' exonuclease n=1 Tax=Micromonospora sp. NPDC048842 TaxID=3154346 RepID=UPI0033EAA1B3